MMSPANIIGKPARSQRAFTLIELIIVLAIAAVLVVVAAPSVRSLIEMQRLRGISDQFVTDLQFTRTEAAGRQEVTGMSFGNGPANMTCYTVHTCGASPAAACFCDCTAAEGARCVAPGLREIRTVQIPGSGKVSLTPVVFGNQLIAADRLMFDPNTGGMVAYYPVSILAGAQPPTLMFRAEASLNYTNTGPVLRTEVSGAGRVKSCSRGTAVSGVEAC